MHDGQDPEACIRVKGDSGALKPMIGDHSYVIIVYMIIGVYCSALTHARQGKDDTAMTCMGYDTYGTH